MAPFSPPPSILPPVRAAATLLAALMLLAACGAPGTDTAASQVLEEVLETHRRSLAGLGAETPGGDEATRPARPSPGGVDALLGRTPDGVLAALGPPTRRRPEGAAEVWLYQGPHCALDLVLYREGGAPPRVAWAAARASGTLSRTEAACLTELIRS